MIWISVRSRAAHPEDGPVHFHGGPAGYALDRLPSFTPVQARAQVFVAGCPGGNEPGGA